MFRWIARSFAALALCAFCAAQFPSEAEAVPTKPVTLTKPAADEYDWFSETVATPGGFLVVWTRSKTSGASAVVAQQFAATGKPAKPQATVRKSEAGVGGRPEIVALPNGKVAMFWFDKNFIHGSVFDLKTNKAGAARQIFQFGDFIHDVVRLANGNIAMVFVRSDISDPSNVREVVSLAILSPSLAVVKAPTTVQAFRADGWNMFDQTIVEKKNGGGLVFYRDRSNGKLLARQFTNAGGLTGAPIQINTTAMSLGSVSDQLLFQVKAVRLTNGNIAVTWVSLEESGADGTQVRARILDAAGKPVGKDFLAHTSKTNLQYSPELVALPAGRFAVQWTTEQYLVLRNHLARVFDSKGKAVAPDKIVEEGTPFALSADTEAARLADGSVVIVHDGFVGANPLRADGVKLP